MNHLHLLHVLLVNLLFLFRLAPRDCEFDFVFEVFKIEILESPCVVHARGDTAANSEAEELVLQETPTTQELLANSDHERFLSHTRGRGRGGGRGVK